MSCQQFAGRHLGISKHVSGDIFLFYVVGCDIIAKKRFRGLMHYVSQLNVLDAMKIVGELFTSHAMARISSFYSLCLYSSLSPWIC